MSRFHRKMNHRLWSRLREEVLDKEPLCRMCSNLGISVAAQEVDHIVPLSLGGLTSRNNLQPLCRKCHTLKTARENKGKIQIGSDGFPLGGDTVRKALRLARNRKRGSLYNKEACYPVFEDN